MRLIALVVVVALPSAALAQSPRLQSVELQNASVVVVDHRLVLVAGDGDEYVLAALEVPESCPAANGGKWACGEGARQTLAAAIKGEVLECSITEPDAPRAGVECFAQTRNLNLWMLSAGRARLTADARGANPSYDDAERVARETGAMNWYLPAGNADEVRLTDQRRGGGGSFVTGTNSIVIQGEIWITAVAGGRPALVLPAARYPLGSRAVRRGATSAERLALGEDLQQDQLRAGVWDYDLFQVVVAESASGCIALTWCRFVVLKDGRPVFDGVARGTPELAAADGAELIWESPGGVWKVWPPSP